MKAKGFLFATILSAVTVGVPGMTSAQSGITLSTTRSLVDGDAGYAEAAAWVNQRHGHASTSVDRRLAGTITITTSLVGTASDAAPLGHGLPPTPLPANGTPGQTITIKNETPTFIETWTYRWDGIGNGEGALGWTEIDYEFHTKGPGCQSSALSGRIAPDCATP